MFSQFGISLARPATIFAFVLNFEAMRAIPYVKRTIEQLTPRIAPSRPSYRHQMLGRATRHPLQVAASWSAVSTVDRAL
jgi:hypothetical protein